VASRCDTSRPPTATDSGRPSVAVTYPRTFQGLRWPYPGYGATPLLARQGYRWAPEPPGSRQIREGPGDPGAQSLSVMVAVALVRRPTTSLSEMVKVSPPSMASSSQITTVTVAVPAPAAMGTVPDGRT